MEPSTLRLLCDKAYEKRKTGAHDVERIIQEAVVAGNTETINKVIDELCIDFAFAKNQPHTKSGGLIGLAAACVALGTTNVSPYLEKIVPPVLAAFSDPNIEVRFYACEAMYNISKVAKREILVFFNEIFDSLCKLVTDPYSNIQTGIDLVDRLIKDIISSESGSNYEPPPDDDDELEQEGTQVSDEGNDDSVDGRSIDSERPFSLERFIPLLQERMKVTNAFSRVFLVSWISFLNAIPDLELVHYLPAFLDGLFAFLSDPNDEVHKATTIVLDDFLAGIKRIAEVQKKEQDDGFPSLSDTASFSEKSTNLHTPNDGQSHLLPSSASFMTTSENDDARSNDAWILASEIEINYPKILAILVEFAGSSSEEIQLRALTWISSFFEICPADIIPFVPTLFSRVLPALASSSKRVQNEAIHVNRELKSLIPAEPAPRSAQPTEEKEAATRIPSSHTARANASAGAKDKDKDKIDERKTSATPTSKAHTQPATPNNATASPAPNAQLSKKPTSESHSDDHQVKIAANMKTLAISPSAIIEPPATPSKHETPSASPVPEFDYATAVSSLTLQFLHDSPSTREAALDWLILLHRQAPRRLLAFHDATFPALLRVLSDPSEAVVTRDLNLLSQISRNTEDSYFTSFMVKLLQLFSTDRRLLDNRGNLIIRQLCMNLSPERIYRTLADCLKKEEDIEFSSIMVQNLNNNLITAPELADLRKRLRNIDTREGQQFFVSLFKSWCGNAVATFSLCLLAQAYEQAYNLLQTFSEFEINLNILIQIDKLVQLLESPVFTYLRLQLLEPDKYPYLYKCLYAVLMLLPQSSAFGALKNRLNSINLAHLQTNVGNARGTMNTNSSPNVVSSVSGNFAQNNSSSSHERSSGPRVGKMREGESSIIPWAELLDQFRSTQERYRRSRGLGATYLESNDSGAHGFVNDVAPMDLAQGEPGISSSSVVKDTGSDSAKAGNNTRAAGQGWRSRGGLASLRLGIGNRKSKK